MSATQVVRISYFTEGDKANEMKIKIANLISKKSVIFLKSFPRKIISKSLDELSSDGKILVNKLLDIDGMMLIEVNKNIIILKKKPVFDWERSQLLHTVRDYVSFLAKSRDSVIISKNGMIL